MIGTESTFVIDSDRRKPSSALLRGSSALDLVDTASTQSRFFSNRATEQAGIASAAVGPKKTLEERLFDALAEAKVWTSRVAMHLDRTSRNRYFTQLDRLHDADEWFGDDTPLRLGSYKGFIRFMLMIGGCSRPSMALSPSGYLLAVWEVDGARLSVEFRDETEVMWMMSHVVNGKPERTGGTTVSERLLLNLRPYAPEKWFNIGNG
ncbi:MAG: hypothetical protein WC729_29015 [Sphingomonas sp.]|jgi:hypothetical protein|uniref:hypothetical protein n=1 Tax=Sphingomonas sp. TaxID=28214 RepID=UPI003563FE43